MPVPLNAVRRDTLGWLSTESQPAQRMQNGVLDLNEGQYGYEIDTGRAWVFYLSQWRRLPIPQPEWQAAASTPDADLLLGGVPVSPLNPIPVALPASGQLGDLIAALTSGLLSAPSISGKLVNLNDTVVLGPLVNQGMIAVVLSGTWSGTVTPQVSVDGGQTWTATGFINKSGTGGPTVTANGQYLITGTGGASHVRVNFTTATSGIVLVYLRAATNISSNEGATIFGPDGSPLFPAAAALADAAANPTTTSIGADLMIWNGTTWDRVSESRGDGISQSGILASGIMVYTGSAYDRLRTANSSYAAGGTTGILGVGLLGSDSSQWQALGTGNGPADAVTGVHNLAVAPWLYNGASFDRARSNSAAALAATTQPFAAMSANPGEWSVSHVPAAAALATATKAAGAAGVRHVLRSLTVTLGSTAAQAAAVTVSVIDGISGGGTYLWRAQLLLTATANSESSIVLSGLNIFGSAATAMTIEFSAAGPANTLETVTMSGYSTI